MILCCCSKATVDTLIILCNSAILKENLFNLITFFSTAFHGQRANKLLLFLLKKQKWSLLCYTPHYRQRFG